MDLDEYKRSAYSEEVRKIMDEIKQKVKNQDTQIEALELIEQHMGKIPPYCFFIVKNLTRLENQEVREKAENVLKEYYEQDLQYKEWERKADASNKLLEKIDEIRSLWSQKIEFPKLDTLKEIRFPPEDSRYATNGAKLDENLERLKELKKSNEIEEEEYKKLKKKIEELDEDVGKAYQ